MTNALPVPVSPLPSTSRFTLVSPCSLCSVTGTTAPQCTTSTGRWMPPLFLSLLRCCSSTCRLYHLISSHLTSAHWSSATSCQGLPSVTTSLHLNDVSTILHCSALCCTFSTVLHCTALHCRWDALAQPLPLMWWHHSGAAISAHLSECLADRHVQQYHTVYCQYVCWRLQSSDVRQGLHHWRAFLTSSTIPLPLSLFLFLFLFLCQTTWLVAYQEPGDAIFVPSAWHHQVTNLVGLSPQASH